MQSKTVMDEVNDKGFLSSYLIYCLPFLFLVPFDSGRNIWWPFPNIGPVVFTFFAAACLLVLYLYENLSGGKKINITLEHKIFIFWMLLTIVSIGLVIIGVRPSLDSVGTRLYSGMPPYFLAFMVFLIVRNNGWKIKNFERLSQVILLVSLIWSVESFITWYLGINIPGLISVGWKEGESYFSGGFTNSLHVISKVSLVAIWLCVYFYFKYGLMKYVFLAVGNFLVIISTANRASIVALIIFILFFVYLMFVKYPNKRITQQTKVSAVMKGVFLVSLLVAVIGIGQFVVNNKAIFSSAYQRGEAAEVGNMLSDTNAFLDRALQYARATEVILQYPLGVGAGLGYLMCYSSGAREIFLDDMRQVEPFLTFSKYNQSGMFGANLEQRKVGSNRAFSIHNTTLNWLMDYGIFSLVLLVFYFYWLVRYYKLCNFLMRKKYYNLGRTCFSLLFCQLSVFLAMQATPKFNHYWILVFLLLFFMSVYRTFIEDQRKQLQNQK